MNFTQEIHLGWLSAKVANFRLRDSGLGRNVSRDFFNLEQRLGVSLKDFSDPVLLELS